MKILLIEDEPKTAQTIKTWLEDSQIYVDCAYDGNTGKLLGERNVYDVIISDVILPYTNGIDLCTHFRKIGVNTPILLLSALSLTEDKVNGLNAGADDYMAKPFEFNELMARIMALVRRTSPAQNISKKLSFADIELNLDTLEVWRSGTKINLTPREFDLIEYFIRNQGRVLSKSEILEKVWGLDVEINTNVIEVYVNYLRNKMDKGFETKLIHTHFGVGYILKLES
jgi:two-component system, OmpR family, copper resistance phosphate regulon response regulator CusR